MWHYFALMLFYNWAKQLCKKTGKKGSGQAEKKPTPMTTANKWSPRLKCLADFPSVSGTVPSQATSFPFKLADVSTVRRLVSHCPTSIVCNVSFCMRHSRYKAAMRIDEFAYFQIRRPLFSFPTRWAFSPKVHSSTILITGKWSCVDETENLRSSRRQRVASANATKNKCPMKHIIILDTCAGIGIILVNKNSRQKQNRKFPLTWGRAQRASRRILQPHKCRLYPPVTTCNACYKAGIAYLRGTWDET